MRLFAILFMIALFACMPGKELQVKRTSFTLISTDTAYRYYHTYFIYKWLNQYNNVYYIETTKEPQNYPDKIKTIAFVRK